VTSRGISGTYLEGPSALVGGCATSSVLHGWNRQDNAVSRRQGKVPAEAYALSIYPSLSSLTALAIFCA